MDCFLSSLAGAELGYLLGFLGLGFLFPNRCKSLSTGICARLGPRTESGCVLGESLVWPEGLRAVSCFSMCFFQMCKLWVPGSCVGQ